MCVLLVGALTNYAGAAVNFVQELTAEYAEPGEQKGLRKKDWLGLRRSHSHYGFQILFRRRESL
jgi:hypothetical protein